MVSLKYLDFSSEAIVPGLHLNQSLPVDTPPEVFDHVSRRVVGYLFFNNENNSIKQRLWQKKWEKIRGTYTGPLLWIIQFGSKTPLKTILSVRHTNYKCAFLKERKLTNSNHDEMMGHILPTPFCDESSLIRQQPSEKVPEQDKQNGMIWCLVSQPIPSIVLVLDRLTSCIRFFFVGTTQWFIIWVRYVFLGYGNTHKKSCYSHIFNCNNCLKERCRKRKMAGTVWLEIEERVLGMGSHLVAMRGCFILEGDHQKQHTTRRHQQRALKTDQCTH